MVDFSSAGAGAVATAGGKTVEDAGHNSSFSQLTLQITTTKTQDGPLQEMFASIYTISPFSSFSAASPRSPRRPSGAGWSLKSGAGGGGVRSSLLRQSTASSPSLTAAFVAGGRQTSQASSGSVSRPQTAAAAEEEAPLLSPPTAAGPRSAAASSRQVVVEERVLTRLMEKIDSLEARLRELEEHEPEQRGKERVGKR